MFNIFKKQKNSKGISFYLFNKKIFNIKPCLRNLIKDLEKDIDGLSGIFNATISPSDIKQAKGILRDIQISDLKILKEIDRIAKENNISYWLDYGSLLGAVRHDGFIPWDDDIDISMIREDYEHFIELFNKNTTDTNLRAFLCMDHVGQIITKIAHKDAPDLIFVDIFPVDLCYQKMDDAEKFEFSNKLKSISKKERRVKFSSASDKQQYYIKLRDDKIPNLKKIDDVKPTIFYGLEFHHAAHPYNCFDYETIFPLKHINFEGYSFPCVNDEDLYLTMIFGDYMSLPRRLHYHNDLSKTDIQKILTIKHYAKD